mmetsp:Transcript_25999/g.54143  ORF Transcript_25999/g.54143 Transcript_25999/m.54143 type:complete len:132 (+) Transcript_25999:277-672(+)
MCCFLVYYLLLSSLSSHLQCTSYRLANEPLSASSLTSKEPPRNTNKCCHGETRQRPRMRMTFPLVTERRISTLMTSDGYLQAKRREYQKIDRYLQCLALHDKSQKDEKEEEEEEKEEKKEEPSTTTTSDKI